MEKICNTCGFPKPLDAFDKHPEGKDGHINQCKECRKKYRAQHEAKRLNDTNWIPWHLRNKEQAKQNKIRWIKANPEKARAQYKKDYQKVKQDPVKNTFRALSNVLKLMIKRCDNPKDAYYADYGGRGITVCDEWRQSKKAFIKWALANGYAQGLYIERLNNNGNYEPSNCAWKSMKEQANNTRRNVFIVIDGETKSLTQCAEFYGVPISRAHYRYRRGYSPEIVFSQTKFKNARNT